MNVLKLKTAKKIILFSLMAIALFITSCSSDDDFPKQDPLIGSWTLTRIIEDGEDIELKCRDIMKWDVNADGTMLLSAFSINRENGNCEIYIDFRGKWENTGDNFYKVLDVREDDPAISIVFEGNTLTSDSFGDGSELLIFTKS